MFFMSSLFDLFSYRLLLEQYYLCKNPSVRAKIAALYGLLSKTPNADCTRIVNDIINLMKKEGSIYSRTILFNSFDEIYKVNNIMYVSNYTHSNL